MTCSLECFSFNVESDSPLSICCSEMFSCFLTKLISAGIWLGRSLTSWQIIHALRQKQSALCRVLLLCLTLSACSSLRLLPWCLPPARSEACVCHALRLQGGKWKQRKREAESERCTNLFLHSRCIPLNLLLRHP